MEARLEQVKQTLFSLKPIPQAEYKAIDEGPANRSTSAGSKLIIEPLLTEQLITEATGPDTLPLTAFILERLLLQYGALTVI